MLAALAAGGEDEVFLWPCNVRAWQCWCGVQTQWRIGFGGATGLDYAAVLAYLRTAERLRGDELLEVFEGLRAAERAVLEARSVQG